MTTTPQENAALVRRFLTDVVASGDLDALDAFVAEDVDEHDLVFGDDRKQEATDVTGQSVLAAVDDIDVVVEDVVATGDSVAVRATVGGTHRGSLLELAPTGESFEIACAWFYHIEDGQIAEVWSLPDGLGLLQQVDALPGEP